MYKNESIFQRNLSDDFLDVLTLEKKIKKEKKYFAHMTTDPKGCISIFTVLPLICTKFRSVLFPPLPSRGIDHARISILYLSARFLNADISGLLSI